MLYSPYMFVISSLKEKESLAVLLWSYLWLGLLNEETSELSPMHTVLAACTHVPQADLWGSPAHKAISTGQPASTPITQTCQLIPHLRGRILYRHCRLGTTLKPKRHLNGSLFSGDLKTLNTFFVFSYYSVLPTILI